MRTNNLIKVNVILPIYNPPKNWEILALASCYFIREQAPLCDWQFHFVNDGSSNTCVFDSIRNQKPNFIHLHEYKQNRGKGFAIRYGFRKAGKATINIHSDWDFPFGEEIFLQSIQALKFCDILLAHRNSTYHQKLPLFRQLLTLTQKFINKYILNLNQIDTQAGFKAFNRKGYDYFMSTSIDSFLFDTEFIALAQKDNLIMTSIDTYCREELKFKNFSSTTVLNELRNFTKIFKARYAVQNPIAYNHRLRRV